MIAELGHFALILALGLCIAQAWYNLYGAWRNDPALIAAGRLAVTSEFLMTAVAFGCLTWSFVINDFSVAYVAQNSNSALPLGYRIAAVWGAHEGSLLLWILVLAGWTFAVAMFSKGLDRRFAARVLGVMGLIGVGFLLFTLLTSNPFERLVPAALDGRDLNPILQDPALAIHPPMLYMGYVGFSVAFAFAVAAMLEGKLDTGWARWTRRWTTLAWLFLTVGITLGSWWAYYELGWGGWWFWDPVENASFMPWLVGTALIHSLAVTEKRGAFPGWTLFLAITAFSLSLLGTFLVRSGVLVSVHAFASDPARGVFILVFLSVVIGSALTLYAWRAPQLAAGKGFKPFARETFLLLNNLLLVVAAALILLGTLYPLILDALGLGKISVGEPYFSLVFMVPMLPLAILLGIGPHVRWYSDNVARLAGVLRWPLAVGLVGMLIVGVFVYGAGSILTYVGIFAGLWILASSLAEPVVLLRSQRRMPRAVVGKNLAHFGVGLFVLGVTVTSSFSVEQDIGMAPGDSVEVSGYTFRFDGLRDFNGPNYAAREASIFVSRDGKDIGMLKPQKRIYRVQTSPMTESAIDAGLSRDLYVAMGEPLGNDRWSVRLQYKPLIRLVWLGALLMALGGLLAASDKRYRLRAEQTAPQGEAVPERA